MREKQHPIGAKWTALAVLKRLTSSSLVVTDSSRTVAPELWPSIRILVDLTGHGGLGWVPSCLMGADTEH